MDVLVSGFRKWEFEVYVKPIFDNLGYAGLNYYLIPDRIEAQKLIAGKGGIDLLVLGGAPAKDFEDECSEDNTDYFEYADFARKNSQIPSILITRQLCKRCC